MDKSDRQTTPQPGECISYRLRRAARAIARHYDKALKPAGVRNTQFTLLNTLDMEDDITIGDMAKILGIDATTLTRNLDVLVRRGLVENIRSDDARERHIRLSSTGKEAFTVALPLWQTAQQILLDSLKNNSWPETMQTLNSIEQTCNSSG